MALNALKSNHLASLGLKGLSVKFVTGKW